MLVCAPLLPQCIDSVTPSTTWCFYVYWEG